MKNVLFVKIHRALAEGKSIKIATSKAWKIKKELGDSIDYVVGMNHSDIAGVFKVVNGKVGLIENRYEFELKENTDLKVEQKVEQLILEAPKPMRWVVKSGEISI